MTKEKAERRLRRLEIEKLDLLRVIHGSDVKDLDNNDVFKSSVDGSVFRTVIDAYGYVNFTVPDQGGYYQQPLFQKPVMKDQAIEWLIRNACYRLA